jgi:hypothetical protein
VACDATARLYDVDERSVVFYKLQKTKRYDQGTITFRARKGKLISLEKLHESIWATRLSNRTRSGLVNLQVTVVGKVVTAGGKTVLQVSDSKAEFVLGRHSEAQFAPLFAKLQAVSGERVVQITGVIDDYQGRWPAVLAKKPPKTRRILVTGIKTVENK